MKYKLDVSMWFDTKTERDAQKAKIKADFDKVTPGKANGRIKVHKCYHDEPVNKPCETIIQTIIGNGGFD